MTHLYNDPTDFKDEVIEGFAAAYGRYVDRVPDAAGFVRRGGPRESKVSLIVGGGSGHYPSYAGIVGTGLADACVLGDVFTSPSAEQIYRVARAADGGAGIVLAFGNYAGDRLNFAAARDRLIGDGIDTRIVYVTDDIASAQPDAIDQRRGIAGTAIVYKIGGAAADAGEDLDAVERIMRAANRATFTIGVAFAGCTFPGKDEPLFEVAQRSMELGLGIHGEPGVRTVPWMPARELAKVLTDAVLAERPEAASGRAAVVVNGLGATKYEELFVLHGHIERELTAAGVEPVMTEVGEFVTSLDMAGCSLSITWLDEELETHWVAPADTAAFRRTGTSEAPRFAARTPVTAQELAAPATIEASDASVAAARIARLALCAMSDVAAENEERLGRIDAVAGDGDHGVGMTRGLRAAVAAADGTEGGIGTVLRAAGEAFGDKAGGTSGMLWCVLLITIGDVLGDRDAVTGPRLAAALHRGTDAMQRVGGAQLGDKTMLDAYIPFAEAFEKRLELRPEAAPDGGIGVAWRDAARVAVAAADATAPLVPRIGRARPLAERSVGTPDAGAISMGLVLTAVAEVVADTAHGGDGPDVEDDR